MDLSQCKVLLTGATGGIGEALANALLHAGASVLLTGRNEAKLESLKARLCAAHETKKLTSARISIISADLCSEQDRQSVVVRATSMGINLLINNAGVNQFRMFSETELENLINTNVTATMRLTQMYLPALLVQCESNASEEGVAPVILNVGSAFGSIGFPGYVAYCATKHAIKGFTEALARELSDTAIKVLYVSPRATDTNMNGDLASQANRALGVKSDSAALVAANIVSAIQNQTARKQIGWPERAQVKLNTLFPSVVDKAINGQLAILKQFLIK